MNCSLNFVNILISLAISFLVAAIAASAFWVGAVSLFVAAGLVASVQLGLIPAINNALRDYAACRGPTNCNSALAVNALGQAAAILSTISFVLAAALELSALALISSFFLSLLGLGAQAAVYYLVKIGQTACVAAAAILAGVLTQAYSFKSCVDKEHEAQPPVFTSGGIQ